jgi:hypothetical protein
VVCISWLRSRRFCPQCRRSLIIAVNDERGVGIESHSNGTFPLRQATKVIDHTLRCMRLLMLLHSRRIAPASG